MRQIVLRLVLAATLLALGGCAASKVGAACYVPWGVAGSCQVTMGEPAPANAATVAR